MQVDGYNSCTHGPPILETQSGESHWTPPFSEGDRRYGQDFQKPAHPVAPSDCPMPAYLLRACLESLPSATPVGRILAGTKVEREVRLRLLDSCLPGLSSAPSDEKANWKGDGAKTTSWGHRRE